MSARLTLGPGHLDMAMFEPDPQVWALPLDTIVSGPSDNSVEGTSGNDDITVNNAAYLVEGQGGADTIHSSSTNPGVVIAGFAFQDMGAGQDGADTIIGGSGSEEIMGCAGADKLYGGDGNDVVLGAISGGAQSTDGNDYIDLGAGNDIGRGNIGNDTILGGVGDDALFGEWGNDRLYGGDGVDSVGYGFTSATAAVTFSGEAFISGAQQTFADGLGGTDVLNSIEFLRITGSLYNDLLTGSAFGDVIAGYEGNDTLQGLGGDDTMFANLGDSRLVGGDGNDRLVAGDSYAGGDTMDGAHATLLGGAGADVGSVQWSDAPDAITVTLTSKGKLTGSMSGGVLSVQGASISAIEVLAGAGNDTITGGAGNDTVLGGAGDDHVVGAAGHDTFVVDNNYSTNSLVLDASGLDVQGGSGVITTTAFGADHLSGIESLRVYGGLNNDTIIGSAGADTLTDGTRAEYVDNAAKGSDSIDGGGGDDLILADFTQAHHTLSGGAGTDTLQTSGVGGVVVDLAHGTATSAADATSVSQISGFEAVLAGDSGATVYGSAAAETLTGGVSADRLLGSAGDDVIAGEGGGDILSGGVGRDTFVFGSVADSASGALDRITDLTDFDRIDLRGIDADTTQAGDQAFHLVAALDGHAGELALTYSGGRTILSGDVDGDGVGDLQIKLDGDHTDFSNFKF